jgi:zinc/manganese transport system substrate-binding protein
MRSVLPRPLAALVGAGSVIALAAACSTASSATTGSSPAGGSGTSGTVVQVAAAENFWGSIAAQLGGSHAKVTSIITNPDTDPHSYEPTAADARTVAGAQLALVNGIGYDAWADKLLAANPASGRTEVKVGALVGVKEGGNPHQWYAYASVTKVVDAITADYQQLDPADAGYFGQRKAAFLGQALAPYTALEKEIRQKYAGTPIGASESIVTPLAESLGLTMMTPETFLDAMSEGTDPTAQDKATIDQQIKGKKIKVYVYNSQNSTPDVQAQVDEAKAEGIPVTTVTETLSPASDTFEQWQVAELQGLERALAKATGK